AELHDPAQAVPQFAAAVKGSSLEDGLAFVHRRRDTTKDVRDMTGKEELALVALLASPEMLAEFKRVRGVAVGLTGITDQGRPEFALAVVAGDSQAVGLAARAHLTMNPLVRRVGTVGAAKVPVYQYRTPAIAGYDPGGRPRLGDAPPVEGAYETTLAYT